MQKLSMSNVNIVENSVDDFISPHGHLTIDKLHGQSGQRPKFQRLKCRERNACSTLEADLVIAFIGRVHIAQCMLFITCCNNIVNVWNFIMLSIFLCFRQIIL